VCDVPRIVGVLVACRAVGVASQNVYCAPDGRARAVLGDGTTVRLVDWAAAARPGEAADDPVTASRS
jgi:hypothetical protein